MRIFKRRPATVGAVLVSAAATALFVLPASPASAAPNQAPTADAGFDRVLGGGSENYVTLNGNHSFDPDGDDLDYSWTQTSGPTVALSGAHQGRPSFLAPFGPATLEFELEVCDPEPPCDTDTVTITVLEPYVNANRVIVVGPTSAFGTQKTFTVRAWANQGHSRGGKLTVCPEDIDATVEVNGAELGTIEALSPCQTLASNEYESFNFRWNYNPPPVFPRDVVVYSACVNVGSGGNCDSISRIARK